MAVKVSRRKFINSAAATGALVAGARIGLSSQVQRPNVLFILADDLGYGDLSCYGRPDYQTAGTGRTRWAGNEVHERLCGGASVHADEVRLCHRTVSAAHRSRIARAADRARSSTRDFRRTNRRSPRS